MLAVKIFFLDLFHALWFGALEYDSKLQRDKTTSERIVRWLLIGLLALGIIATLIFGIWKWLDSIEIRGI